MSSDAKNRTCFFTGHRTLNEKKIRPLVRSEIEKAYSLGYIYYGAGGALGFDSLAAEEVLAAKQLHPEICLILVLPYPDYKNKWKMEDIARMENIMKKADKVVHVQNSYSKDAYLARNRRMADYSSRCICYKEKDRGGTAYTLAYVEELKSKGQAIDVINIAKINS